MKKKVTVRVSSLQSPCIASIFSFLDSLFSGNLARQLLDALNEAQDLEQFEANWAVKQVKIFLKLNFNHF